MVLHLFKNPNFHALASGNVPSRNLAGSAEHTINSQNLAHTWILLLIELIIAIPYPPYALSFSHDNK
jgi:hypothetical protein